MQLDEKPVRVVGVDPRFERHVKIGEGGRVLQQIDLHASDIDRADSAGLQPQNGPDRVGFIIEI